MLVDSVDFFRLDANRKLDPDRRSDFGQFMTPPATARLMASMFEAKHEELTLLDAGAGVGSLTAAFVSEVCSRKDKPKSIRATAHEIDSELCEYLVGTLQQCKKTCESSGIAFDCDVIQGDFIDEGAGLLRNEMFSSVRRYNCAIMNPPYRKINSDSSERRALRAIGVETSNLYTGFLAVVLRMLEAGGELVAITPRSFCNGLYFKSFRKILLDTLALRRIHVFDSRQVAFKEDDVLQENVIFHGGKGPKKSERVTISSSTGPEDDFVTVREVPHEKIVRPGDPEHYIHIVPDELGASVAHQMSELYTSLAELDVEVSTGRVVDFRATDFLRDHPTAKTVPLIYPRNFENGYIRWPKPGNKPQALAVLPGAQELLVPKGIYVLVKRFSSKEEKRRVVAALYDPKRIPAEWVGFENHTNFFHRNGKGLASGLAKGFAAFLNSTLVDLYFRQFSGHTQVNATDLRNFRYPRKSQLEQLGSRIGDEFPSQEEIDRDLGEVLNLADEGAVSNPVQAKKKLDEALEILKALGVPRDQQNERSALTLLSLLDLKPDTPWSKASAPLMGITPMMEFFGKHYGKVYAPNTRETVRRQTIHQFLDAGIVVINPDEPERPTNSGKTVYQTEAGLLELLRTWGTAEWEKGIKTYLSSVETLKKKYAQERQAKRIPIEVAPGKIITLSPGGQNILVEKIIDDFCGLFTPGGKMVYVGDTGEKFAYFAEALLKSLGVEIESHGKMTDVVVYHEKKNWLVLIEAVTSHGPVNPKRMSELKKLFKGSKAGLVFVTAFLDRQSMLKYLDEISWETEVWVAESPTHLIHFNGERFLGPYPETKE
ncbi:MAG TPA: BsuBI/PstI family type II restriction endonuclease [Candidatus Acidoferrales bacterium]|nr:BsuBI/PstI family type II restriction endonuclease [Candidatus Acidoferrales bacterium]